MCFTCIGAPADVFLLTRLIYYKSQLWINSVEIYIIFHSYVTDNYYRVYQFYVIITFFKLFENISLIISLNMRADRNCTTCLNHYIMYFLSRSYIHCMCICVHFYTIALKKIRLIERKVKRTINIKHLILNNYLLYLKNKNRSLKTSTK